MQRFLITSKSLNELIFVVDIAMLEYTVKLFGVFIHVVRYLYVQDLLERVTHFLALPFAIDFSNLSLVFYKSEISLNACICHKLTQGLYNWLYHNVAFSRVILKVRYENRI